MNDAGINNNRGNRLAYGVYEGGSHTWCKAYDVSFSIFALAFDPRVLRSSFILACWGSMIKFHARMACETPKATNVVGQDIIDKA